MALIHMTRFTRADLPNWKVSRQSPSDGAVLGVGLGLLIVLSFPRPVMTLPVPSAPPRPVVVATPAAPVVLEPVARSPVAAERRDAGRGVALARVSGPTRSGRADAARSVVAKRKAEVAASVSERGASDDDAPRAIGEGARTTPRPSARRTMARPM